MSVFFRFSCVGGEGSLEFGFDEVAFAGHLELFENGESGGELFLFGLRMVQAAFDEPPAPIVVAKV